MRGRTVKEKSPTRPAEDDRPSREGGDWEWEWEWEEGEGEGKRVGE